MASVSSCGTRPRPRPHDCSHSPPRPLTRSCILLPDWLKWVPIQKAKVRSARSVLKAIFLPNQSTLLEFVKAAMPNVRSKILLSSSHGYVQKTSRPDDRHFMDPAPFKDWDIEASGGRHVQTFFKELRNRARVGGQATPL